MPPATSTTKRLLRELLPARRGVGPLLQRDYWGLVRSARLSPAEVADLVACRFEELPPPDLVRFARTGRGEREPLEPGDELSVRIRGAGEFAVRVLHRDRLSLTLGTLAGHPEAGRITFGAYPNDFGDLLFHIRSRARSGSRFQRAGFLALGEAMQTACWTGFVDTVANTVGEGVVGYVHAVTSRLAADEPDEEVGSTPTFLARDDR